MISYISYINPVLDFIIKVSIIFGVAILGYFYWKIRSLDREIEALSKKFEKTRGEMRKIELKKHFGA